MTPLWAISGKFAGWIINDREFYKPNGKRYGVISTEMLFDFNGNYIGRILNIGDSLLRIGREKKMIKWNNPPFDLNSSIIELPLKNISSIEVDGFIDPEF
jgi:hypothetical protein